MLKHLLHSSAVTCLAISAAHAQQTVALRGTVIDASGAPVPSAVIELALPDGQLQAQATTATNGDFTLPNIAAGSYVLSVPATNGFAAQTRSVQITASTAALKLVLIPETVNQTIDVGGGEQLATDAASNKDSVSVGAATLDHLPVFDQNIVGALTPFLDPSTTSSSGVSIVVDGIEMKEVNVSPSAISEVRINSDPYSVEFASPGRGRLEITTKPGSPQYHGTLNFITRDAVFNGKNYFAPTKPAEQRRIYEGHLLGPIGHGGHTTFLLSGTRQKNDLQSAVHAAGPQGFIDQNVATPSRNSQIALRISHDFSAAHRLAVTYHYHYNTTNNVGVGGIVLPQAGYNNNNAQDQLVISDRIIISPNLVHQFQLQLEHELDSQVSATTGQSIQVSDSFTGGSAQMDIYRTEHTVSLVDVTSWTHGKHYVRFGVTIPQISRRAVDDHSNRLGTYSFLSLTDYASAKPYRYTVQQGVGRALYVASEIATFAQDEVSLRKNLQVTVGLRYQFQTYLNDFGNFAPRVSVAYAPLKGWVLRGGGGIFYDRSGGDFPVTYKLHNGSVLRQYQVLNPGFPTPLPPGQNFTGFPTNIARLAPGIGAAYQVLYSATLERQLSPSLTATASYRGYTGIKTFRSRDANAPLPPYTVRPDTSLGLVQQIEAGGRSSLSALELGLRGSIHHGDATWFEGQAQYVFSHNNTNTAGIGKYPQDQFHPGAEWGRADTDRRQRLNLLGTINPDHWLTLGFAVALYSGTPYTMLAGTDRYNTGLGNARPIGVGRNTLQGGGTASLDLQWDHDVHLNKAKKEGAKILNIALSSFNVLNHANFTNYIGSVRSPLFGTATAALAGRQMQFGLRYQF